MVREVDIEELRRITNLIFDHIIEVLNTTSVELNHDMYWSISPNEMFDLNKEPTNLGVGQLYDDLDFLKSIATNPDQASPAMLLHLAPLFNYLSTKIDWYVKSA